MRLGCRVMLLRFVSFDGKFRELLKLCILFVFGELGGGNFVFVVFFSFEIRLKGKRLFIKIKLCLC